MKPRFVAFNNGSDRYLFNINNISTVAIHENDVCVLVIEITSIDGSVDEIAIGDYEVANNIFDGIINALNAPSNVMVYHIVENTK